MPTGQLSEISDGLSIFIDANIFIYHFSGPTPLSPACSAFLRRIEDGVIRGPACGDGKVGSYRTGLK